MKTTTSRTGRLFFFLPCLVPDVWNPGIWSGWHQRFQHEHSVPGTTPQGMRCNLNLVAILLLCAMINPGDSYARTGLLEPPRDWQSEYFQDHPLVGTVWRGNGNPATWQELTLAVDEAQHVLVGEIHPNADHHQLQAAILASVVAGDKQATVVWEMIPSARQSVVDAWSMAETPDVHALGQMLEWADSGWPAWSLYQPIAQIAAQNRVKMIGAALPRETMMKIGGKGAAGITEDILARLHLDIPLNEQAEAGLMKSLREGHCNLLPEEALAPMSIAQRARDGAMADAMLRENIEGRSVLIAGNGHIRNDWGVGGLLSILSPQAKSVSIAQIEVQDDQADSDAYIERLDASNGFDFLVFTPRAEITDYCAELRQRFSSKK